MPTTIRYQVFDRRDQVVTKERTFKCHEDMAKWVAKQDRTNPNFIAVTAYSTEDK